MELPSVNSLSLLANCFVRDIVKTCHPWLIPHITPMDILIQGLIHDTQWTFGEEGSKAWVGAIVETTSANKT